MNAEARTLLEAVELLLELEDNARLRYYLQAMVDRIRAEESYRGGDDLGTE